MLSPSDLDYEESICTLRYASRVKYIKNHTHVNVETKQGLIESFEKEIEELQKRIQTITMQEEMALKAVSLFIIAVILFYYCIAFAARKEKRQGNERRNKETRGGA